MKLSDPATWPQHPGLFYRRASNRLIAHAFFEGTTSLCNAISLGPGGGARPTKQQTRLCSNCIGWLRKWGYLARSEVVEET